MNRKWIRQAARLVLGVGIAATASLQPALAAVPGFINYQARLTNASGAPLEGSQSLTFRFYPTASDPTPLATETITATANKGLVSALIPAAASVFSGAERWLEVQVGPETLSPRTRLVTVPYAFSSEQSADKETLLTYRLNGVLVAKNNVDGGAVAPFDGTITSVNVYRRVAGSSGSTTADIHKNGTTIFTTQANRPSVASASGNGAQATATNMEVTAVAAGDVLSSDVDAVEGGDPEDLVISVRIRRN